MPEWGRAATNAMILVERLENMVSRTIERAYEAELLLAAQEAKAFGVKYPDGPPDGSSRRYAESLLVRVRLMDMMLPVTRATLLAAPPKLLDNSPAFYVMQDILVELLGEIARTAAATGRPSLQAAIRKAACGPIAEDWISARYPTNIPPGEVETTNMLQAPLTPQTAP